MFCLRPTFNLSLGHPNDFEIGDQRQLVECRYRHALRFTYDCACQLPLGSQRNFGEEIRGIQNKIRKKSVFLIDFIFYRFSRRLERRRGTSNCMVMKGNPKQTGQVLSFFTYSRK